MAKFSDQWKKGKTILKQEGFDVSVFKERFSNCLDEMQELHFEIESQVKKVRAAADECSKTAKKYQGEITLMIKECGRDKDRISSVNTVTGYLHLLEKTIKTIHDKYK